jgi:ABC-type phosphate transport system substrate-binding protein
MKKRIITGLLILALGVTGCGSDTAAEATAAPATTAAAASPMSTAAETTAANTTEVTKTATSSATEPKAKKTFPIIDGSTSTISLDAYVRAKLRGISTQEAISQTKHNKTFEAFENLVNGKADIVLSVPLAKEQEAFAADNNFEYDAVPVALEGFVFLVNPENPVQSLTQEQIRKIYSGEITNWKELGGNDAPIKAHQRNNNSGSQTYMTEFMGETPLAAAPESLVEADMGAIISMFENYDNSIDAIGYSVYSYAAVFAANEGTFNFVAVDGVKPSRSTFIDGSYPLLSQTYAFYKKNTTDPLVLDYIEFITSEAGQKAVLEAGLLPVMDIEIPETYTLYEARGTGPEMPENPNRNYYALWNTMERPRNFLKDAEFEAEIQDWIDEAIAKNEAFPDWVKDSYYHKGFMIYNGYFSISLGYSSGDLGEIDQYYGYAAVFDIVDKKKIENYSDLFYKDTDFMADVNNTISEKITGTSDYTPIKCDFFGLCYGFDFDLRNIYLKPDSAYFTKPHSFDVFTDENEKSVVTECRDFRDYLTPEYAEKVEFYEYKPKTNNQKFYIKNKYLYTYYDYPDIENDRELEINKNIEETLDAYYKGGKMQYDGSVRCSAYGDFVEIYSGWEGPGLVYCTLQHKFLDLDDLFKEGYEENVEINPDAENNSNRTASEIFEENYLTDYSWAMRYYLVSNISTQISEENDDNYIYLITYSNNELRIDKKWLKDIYQNLPPQTTSASETAPPVIYNDDEQTLKNLIAENTDKELLLWEYGDFDNDGAFEAFAFLGGIDEYDQKSGTLFLVNSNGLNKIQGETYGVDVFTFTIDEYTFAAMVYHDTNDYSRIWGVDGKEAYEPPISRIGQSFTVEKNGEMTITQSAFDNFTMSDGNPNGAHTWKPYYFYYDNGFKEYGGSEISLDELLTYENAAKYIDEIENLNGEITNVLQRPNGIININYRVPDPEVDYLTWNYYYTLKIDDEKVTHITENPDKPEWDNGVYLPALLPEIAVF